MASDTSAGSEPGYGVEQALERLYVLTQAQCRLTHSDEDLALLFTPGTDAHRSCLVDHLPGLQGAPWKAPADFLSVPCPTH